MKNGKSGSWAGIQGFGLVLELEKWGEGRVCLFRVARKRGGGWVDDKCEGDEIVGRIRVGAGERGGVFFVVESHLHLLHQCYGISGSMSRWWQ